MTTIEWCGFAALVILGIAVVIAHFRLTDLRDDHERLSKNVEWNDKRQTDRHWKLYADHSETQRSIDRLGVATGYVWTEGSGSDWKPSGTGASAASSKPRSTVE